MTKGMHTPGPWRVFKNMRGGAVQIDTADGTIVQPGAITWLPNAPLIAAAPELLDALKGLLLWCEDYCDEQSDGDGWITRARAAIAKATGGDKT